MDIGFQFTDGVVEISSEQPPARAGVPGVRRLGAQRIFDRLGGCFGSLFGNPPLSRRARANLRLSITTIFLAPSPRSKLVKVPTRLARGEKPVPEYSEPAHYEMEIVDKYALI